MIHRLWTVFSQVCSSDFCNPHGRFCVDLIVVYVKFSGNETSRSSLPSYIGFSNLCAFWPLLLFAYDKACDLCFWFSNIWNFHSPLEFVLKERWELSDKKIERFCEWVSECVDVCHTPSTAFRHLPPKSARFGYATGRALFISAQLSTDAVSALRKV